MIEAGESQSSCGGNINLKSGRSFSGESGEIVIYSSNEAAASGSGKSRLFI